MNKKNIIYILLGLGLMFCYPLQAQRIDEIQPLGNSPFSRLGLGDILPQGLAVHSGMAGNFVSFIDPYHLNIANPASLAFLQSTAFEIGLFAKSSSLISENGAKSNVWTGNLNYFALGFPLKNPINQAIDRKKTPWGMGMSLGIRPFSQTVYNLELTQSLQELGDAVTAFKGSGGAYRLHWGNAVRYKSFSFGANIYYLFGKSNKARSVSFDSLFSAYTTQLIDVANYRGLNADVGMQYIINLSGKSETAAARRDAKQIILGITLSPEQNFNTISNSFYSRRIVYGTGATVVDTLLVDDDRKVKNSLPMFLTFGATFEHLNRLKIGLQYSSSKWSQYEVDGKSQGLSDGWNFAGGVEYIPDAFSFTSYFARARYRLGAFLGKDPRIVNGESLNTKGITFGLGMPLYLPRQQVSFINTAIEFGQIGLKDGLRENYVRFIAGFTLNDNTWFFKRKFD